MQIERRYHVPIPEYGLLMTVEDFKMMVEMGAFIDDDGVGHPAKNGMMDPSYHIFPSEYYKIPDEITEMIWFNR